VNNPQQSAVTWFDPGDDRVDPRPGDRLAAYCNTTANPLSINVYGVEDDGKGVFLTTFNNVDLLKAGPKGIIKSVNGLGTVSMMQDAATIFMSPGTVGSSKLPVRAILPKRSPVISRSKSNRSIQ
jgi:hypothetical protein